MSFKTNLLSGALILGWAFSSQAISFEASSAVPPKPASEFRGLWIATVANIDWPSKPGLSTAAQKAELISILDRARQLRLNAVIFQVRPACDAFYASKLEPWSEYLTGVMGQAPEPFYDPLSFAVEEAHKRGLELHAWFNPYRALHKSHEGRVSPKHISRTHPELVRRYGQYLWLDPGEPAVQEHSLKVVMDVVKRYDVDAVQFDDYFYLSAEDAGLKGGQFPDEPSWKKYGAGGRLDREEWRRENVNGFVERVYRSIKAAKPWVKFGISPFGIWRPGNPAQIKGSDAYTKYFADSRKWLQEGWVDYLAPQLYWQIGQKELSFPVLLDWWSEQNTKGRHLWPGISVANAGRWKAEEIPNQIRLTRERSGTSGYMLYNTSSLLGNTALTDKLEREINTQPALVPPSPWLSSGVVGKPTAAIGGDAESLKLKWSSTGTNSVRWWLVQTKTSSDWQSDIFPSGTTSKMLGVAPEALAITAIDRFGNASAACVLEPKKPSPARPRILQKL